MADLLEREREWGWVAASLPLSPTGRQSSLKLDAVVFKRQLKLMNLCCCSFVCWLVFELQTFENDLFLGGGKKCCMIWKNNANMTSSSNFGGTWSNQKYFTPWVLYWTVGFLRKMSDLLESSLAVLALVSDPSVIALAGPVRAGSWKAAFLAGLEGRGGFTAQHKAQRNANSQVSLPDAPLQRLARGDAHRAIHDGRTAGLCWTAGCREPAVALNCEVILCHQTQVVYPWRRKTVITHSQSMLSWILKKNGSRQTRINFH